MAGAPVVVSECRPGSPRTGCPPLDGVYVAGPDGLPVFRALGRLRTDEVADVVQITKVRVLKALERRGVVRVSPEALEVDDAFAARGPVLGNRPVRDVLPKLSAVD